MKLPNPLRFAVIAAGALAYSMSAVVILTSPVSEPLDNLVKALALGFVTAVFAIACLVEDYTP